MKPTDSRLGDYTARVLRLTPEQRLFLMRELNISAGESIPLQGGAGRLTACIKPQQNRAADLDEIRKFARQHLPDYMVPQNFHIVDDFPRLSTGKVDRNALCGHAWPLRGALVDEKAGYDEPRNEIEERLARIWAEVLGVDQVGIHDNFFEVGGDSLLSIRILARANKAGLHIPPQEFFEYPTVAEQSILVGVAPDQPGPAKSLSEAGLSPIQHWFFDRVRNHREHWNQSVSLRAAPHLDYASLKVAVIHLVSHHDMLRAAIVQDAQGRRQLIREPDQEPPCAFIDLSESREHEIEAGLEIEANRINRGMNLEQGRLVQFLYAEMPPGVDNRLLLIIHHLIIDAESWRILLDDLEATWSAAAAGKVIDLPSKPPSFLHWCARLKEFSNSAELGKELSYWKEKVEDRPGGIPLDHESAADSNVNGCVDVVTVFLNPGDTEALLRTVSKSYHSELTEALLSALLSAYHKWSGQPSLHVDIEGHGRELLFNDLDISRTIGWFTTVFPVSLSMGPARKPSEILLHTKELLRQVPKRGIGHGMLRYLRDYTGQAAPLSKLAAAVVCFNYLGQVDKLQEHIGNISIESEHIGELRHPEGYRAYQLEINTRIVGGRLQVDCIFSNRLHERSTVENFLQNYINYLRDLVSESRQSESDVYTPSDFPLAGLDQLELDTIAGMLSDLDVDAE